MYIRCVRLFSALSRRVGALQISIIIILHGKGHCRGLVPVGYVSSALQSYENSKMSDGRHNRARIDSMETVICYS